MSLPPLTPLAARLLFIAVVTGLCVAILAAALIPAEPLITTLGCGR